MKTALIAVAALAGLSALIAVAALAGLSALGGLAGRFETWDTAAVQAECAGPIRKQLRDPASYQFADATITEVDGMYGKAVVTFRARNGFGGYTVNTAVCESYDQDGQRWVKAAL